MDWTGLWTVFWTVLRMRICLSRGNNVMEKLGDNRSVAILVCSDSDTEEDEIVADSLSTSFIFTPTKRLVQTKHYFNMI